MAVARPHAHRTEDHRRLLGALGIICCTAALELYGGIVTHSLALLAGPVTPLTGWTRGGPLLSLVIVVLLVVAALRLLRTAAAVLLDAVPAGIDLNEVERALRSLPHVRAVHDIHCWQIADGVI